MRGERSEARGQNCCARGNFFRSGYANATFYIILIYKNKLDSLTIKRREKTTLVDSRIDSLNLQREKISTEIENILNTLATTSNQVAISYIEKKISDLDSQKRKIESEIQTIQSEQETKQLNQSRISNAVSKWGELSFDDKRAVVDLLIDKILVFQDHIEIVWRV